MPPLFWFTRYGYAKDEMVELRGYYDANGKLFRTICKRADKNGEMKICELDEELDRLIPWFLIISSL